MLLPIKTSLHADLSYSFLIDAVFPSAEQFRTSGGCTVALSRSNFCAQRRLLNRDAQYSRIASPERVNICFFASKTARQRSSQRAFQEHFSLAIRHIGWQARKKSFALILGCDTPWTRRLWQTHRGMTRRCALS